MADIQELEKLARSGDGEALAQIVKHYRGELSQREFAKLIRLNQRTLEGIEQGRGIAHPGAFILALRYVKEHGAICIACNGTGKYPSGQRCKVCHGTGRISTDEETTR